MNQKLLYGILIGIGASALMLFMDSQGWLDSLEDNTWNRRARYFASSSPESEQVVLILLDQESLDWVESEHGVNWPWYRQLYVPILDFCERAGAKGVAFDVLFTENSVLSVPDDEMLGAAMKDGAPFTLALFLSRGHEQNEVAANLGHVDVPPLTLTFDSPQMEEQWTSSVTTPSAALPISRLATNVSSFGNVSEAPDADGIFRRSHFLKKFAGQWVPSLGLAMYLQSEGAGDGSIHVSGRYIKIGDSEYPVAEGLRSVIRYREPSSFKGYSAAAIIQSELRLQEGGSPPVDPAAFKGRYVLFGFSAPGLKDLRPTPLSPAAPGVIIHANFLENLLSGSLMTSVPGALAVVWTLLLTILGSLLVVLSRKASTTALLLVLLIPVPLLLAFAAYHFGYWLPLVLPELSLIVGMVGAVVVNFATEGRQKMFIKKAFRH